MDSNRIIIHPKILFAERGMKKLFKIMISLVVIGCFAGGCFAWDDELAGTMEITGYYQQYRDFSFKTGVNEYDFAPARIAGGGFSVAQNIAEWFALWTQLSFFGTADQMVCTSPIIPCPKESQYHKSVRIINNLEGIRYQTQQYGPLRFYGKVGAGITWYGFDYFGDSLSGTRFSVGYGGGMNVWMNRNIGITLDVSHIGMNLPNLFDADNRKKWDSGMSYTTGLTFRF